jgi:hypothetical protein
MQPTINTEPIIETRGDDWTWPFLLTGDDESAVDLTGCGFDGAAIVWRGGALPLSITNGRIAVDAPAGAVTVSIARDDTTEVPDGQRAQLVLPITDSLAQRSTLFIVPLQVIAP